MSDHLVDSMARTAAFAKLEEILRKAAEDGIAPGDCVQHLLEAAHRMDPQPCGDGEAGNKLRVTTIEEATGRLDQKVMGPAADYLLTLGPEFEVTSLNRYGNETTQITIKRAVNQGEGDPRG